MDLDRDSLELMLNLLEIDAATGKQIILHHMIYQLINSLNQFPS